MSLQVSHKALSLAIFCVFILLNCKQSIRVVKYEDRIEEFSENYFDFSAPISGLAIGVTLMLRVEFDSFSEEIRVMQRQSQNSDFFFKTSQRPIEGETYRITVESQPQGFTCSITKGFGFVTQEDLAQLKIECTNNRVATGTVDSRFFGGAFLPPMGRGSGNLALDLGGKINLLYMGSDDTPRACRFNNNVLDTTFNSGSCVEILANLNFLNLRAMTTDAQTRMVFAGELARPGTSITDMLVGRLNLGGSLDTSFNSTGINVQRDTCYDTANMADGGFHEEAAKTITISPTTGNIFLGGYTSQDNRFSAVLWGFNSNGTISNYPHLCDEILQETASLNFDGRGNLLFGSNQYVRALNALNGQLVFSTEIPTANAEKLAVDSLGRIYVRSFSRHNPEGDTVLRLLSDGTIDGDFAPINFEHELVVKLLVNARNQVLVLSSGYGSKDDTLLSRVNENGSIDTTFATNGILQIGDDKGPSDMIIDKEGHIIILLYDKSNQRSLSLVKIQ